MVGKFLLKNDIIKNLKTREIILEPRLDDDIQINSTSVDIRLDNYFGIFQKTDKGVADFCSEADEIVFIEKEFYNEPLILHPNQFVLGQSLEYLVLPLNILALLDGRSSIGRKGIVVHATAGGIDPGFSGHITFELANLGEMPIELYPMQRISRLTFIDLGRDAEGYYGQFRLQTKIRKPKPDNEVLNIRDYGPSVCQMMFSHKRV